MINFLGLNKIYFNIFCVKKFESCLYFLKCFYFIIFSMKIIFFSSMGIWTGEQAHAFKFEFE